MGGTGSGRIQVIIPDVNILVHAHREDATDHAAYADWLARTSALPTPALALLDVVLTGFFRVVTNRRIFDQPATPAEAMDFIRALRAAPATTTPPTDGAWTTLPTLVDSDPMIRGNVVPDAWIAANAIALGARVATRDRGLARFPGATPFDPLAAAS